MPADPHNKPVRRDLPPAQNVPEGEAAYDESPPSAKKPKPVPPRSGLAVFAGLLVVLVGLLNLVVGLGLLGLGYYLLNAAPSEAELQLHLSADMVARINNQLDNMADALFHGAIGSFATGILTVVLAFPVLSGGISLVKARNYPRAVFGSLLTFISPGGFFILGPLAGLFALIALLKPSVRESFGGAREDQPDQPRSRAGVIPGILLVVVGLLNLLAGMFFIGHGYYFLIVNPREFGAHLKADHPDFYHKLNSQQYEFLQDTTDFILKGAIASFAVGLVTCLLGLSVLFGGINLVRSRGYWGAVFGSLVAFISPGGFGLLGAAAGLYGLVVLLMPSVRRSFQ